MARALHRFVPLLVPFVALACSDSTGPERDREAPVAVARVLDAQGVHRPGATFAPGEAFRLDGSQSADVGVGAIEQWTWTRLETGFDVSTGQPAVAGAVFYDGDAPAIGLHAFRLVVTDESGNESAPVTVTVTIVDAEAPTAILRALDSTGTPRPNATFAADESFSLDGSQSSDAIGISRWVYTRLETGASVDTTAATIDGDLLFDGGAVPAGSHVIRLVAIDGAGNESAPALLEVRIESDEPPTAMLRALDGQGTPRPNATFAIGESFSLDGSQSADVEGSIAHWRFTLLDTGETVDTTAAIVEGIRFFAAPPVVGSYRFRLVVVDDNGNESAPVELQLQIADNEAPTAIARALDGDGTPVPSATFQIGDAFSLDASQSSDAGGGSVETYRWTLLESGASIDTAATTVDAALLFDGGAATAGTHSFQLVVIDDSGNESPPVVLQVVVTDSEPPTAILRTLDASGQARTVFEEGETITLDASQSLDVAPGRIESYTWRHLQSGGLLVSDTSSIDASVLLGESPPIGTHDFQLVVTDGGGNESAPAQVRVSVVAP